MTGVAEIGGFALLGGVVGLVLGGVDVMVNMAVAGLLIGLFGGVVTAGWLIYTASDEYW